MIMIEGVDLNGLIGLDFKRKKYGLSLWTDKIRYVGYRWNLINRKERQIEIFIVGHNSDVQYGLDEIVVINKELHWVEEAKLDKREFHKKLQDGTYKELIESRRQFKKEISEGADLDETAKKYGIKLIKPKEIKKET